MWVTREKNVVRCATCQVWLDDADEECPYCHGLVECAVELVAERDYSVNCKVCGTLLGECQAPDLVNILEMTCVDCMECLGCKT